MLSAADFIILAYTPDLTQAGLTFTCKWLATSNKRPERSLNQLRQVTGDVAVELAFRRYLHAEAVPHSNVASSAIKDPDRYHITIGGRRCILISYMLTQKQRIRQVRRRPQTLQAAQALVPASTIATGNLNAEDLYIFAFLNALVTPNIQSMHKAASAGQPLFLIYRMPPRWSNPDHWGSLGRIAIKNGNSQPVKLELGGQKAGRGLLTEQISLNPQERLQATYDFYTLDYLQLTRLPDGIIEVHSPVLGDTHHVRHVAWGNLWVYGIDILFTGYTTHGEFLDRANHLPPGSQVYPYRQTQVENLALPIADLHPLQALFARARSWSQRQSH